VATTLQENLIHPLGKFPGLDLGRVSQTAYHPELVGGDFSHVFPVGEGRVGILIGDVEGKGIRAAGLTETVRSAVVAFSLVDPTPGYVLEKTNQLLLEGAGIDQFVTACFLLVDLDSGETSYTIAGHPAPVLLRASSCESLRGAHGLPLGAFPGTYDVSRVKLAFGDCLILLTDGVTEARRHGELFGEQRVLATVRGLGGMGAQDVAESLREAASQFAKELRDDLQILTVRYMRKGAP
jgi:sigma-B regulation protein RsbU (phosphoserine phosphatase)